MWELYIVDMLLRDLTQALSKQSMQVNNNGLLSFLQGVSQFTPEAFPLAGDRKLIAPFWADVDTRGIGTVWFRITTNSSLLARARLGMKLLPSLAKRTLAQLTSSLLHGIMLDISGQILTRLVSYLKRWHL